MGLLITYFLFAICISFVCSVLEAVLFSVTPPFMESYPKIHPKGGRILRYLKANIDNAIGAILIVNLFANTVGAAGVGAQAVKIFWGTLGGGGGFFFNIFYFFFWFFF
ncbi:CNNM domain-containing protein, partial [Helicobacter typhlonius]|uniref:CNNM domain-containing protein n=1 Tax=Helicobacter typhlonius TaxID=76936 RepID=UPI002FE1EE4D